MTEKVLKAFCVLLLAYPCVAGIVDQIAMNAVGHYLLMTWDTPFHGFFVLLSFMSIIMISSVTYATGEYFKGLC